MERGVCVCVSEHRCGSSAAKPNSLVRLQATPQPNRHINHRNRIQFYHQPWPFFFFSISRSLFVACISSSLILRLLQLLYLHCHWQQCSLATLCSINNTNKMLGKCEKNIMNHMQCGPSHALTNQQIIKKKSQRMGYMNMDETIEGRTIEIRVNCECAHGGRIYLSMMHGFSYVCWLSPSIFHLK